MDVRLVKITLRGVVEDRLAEFSKVDWWAVNQFEGGYEIAKNMDYCIDTFIDGRFQRCGQYRVL